MIARRLLCLIVVAVSLSTLTCKSLSRKNYNVDHASPNGMYRVKVDVRVEDEETLIGGFNEWGKIQFFKGQERIESYEWKRKANFESTFIDDNPVIEWMGDKVLRMGQDRSDEQFLDVLVVSNNTGENLSYASVSCGKYEQFTVFDLASGGQIRLRASPVASWVTSDGSTRYSLGYGGTTTSGKKFAGAVEQEQIKSRDDGPLEFQININPKDLQQR